MEGTEGDSNFSGEFQKFKNMVPAYIGKVSRPEEVARLILLAVTTKNPRRVYHINHSFAISLLSALPVGIQQFLIKRQIKD